MMEVFGIIYKYIILEIFIFNVSVVVSTYIDFSFFFFLNSLTIILNLFKDYFKEVIKILEKYK